MQTVVVGKRVTVFRPSLTLRGLRRFVDVSLAERGEHHCDAAGRAAVSRAYWSRLMNAGQLTERDFERIAAGLGMTTSALARRLKAEGSTK